MGYIKENEFQALLEMLKTGEGRDWQPFLHIFNKHEKPIIWSKFDLLRNDPKTRDDVIDFEDHCQNILLRLSKNIDKSVAKTEEYDLPTRIKMYAGWTKEIIENYFLSYIDVTKRRIKGDSVDQSGTDVDIPAPEGDEASDTQLQNLIDSFKFVMNSKRKIYIKLTWISCVVIMIAMSETRINATWYIEKALSNYTLGEMYRVIENAARKITWLRMDSQSWCKLEAELSETHKGLPYAECFYSDFYMDKGARASISNWISNINKEIKKEGLSWLI